MAETKKERQENEYNIDNLEQKRRYRRIFGWSQAGVKEGRMERKRM